MIITALLNLILFILGVVSNIFGPLIPNYPDTILTILDTVSTMIDGGISFISYFVYWPVLAALISIIIEWYAFIVIKNIIMKVIGHFLAN